MDLTYPAEAEAFRCKVRDWLHGELPDGWFEGRRPTGAARHRFAAEWNAMLHRTGWSCPTGRSSTAAAGCRRSRRSMLAEESPRPARPDAGAGRGRDPRRPDASCTWGTEEQKERFLPPISRAIESWCQGFSEPGVGSDLASLDHRRPARRRRVGVDGEKIWTSEAKPPTNDPAGPHRSRLDRPRRHLVPAAADAPTRRRRCTPIAQPDGTAGFTRVDFDGARCPAENLVGGVGNGWKVAMTTLGFERGTSTTTSYHRFAASCDTNRPTRRRGRLGDPLVRQRMCQAVDRHPDHARQRLPRGDGRRARRARGVAGRGARRHEGAWTELHQRLTELGIDVLGPAGQILDGVAGAPPVVGVGMGRRDSSTLTRRTPSRSTFLFARSGTIFGGTSEIQRNLIAERVLGLPREPRP